MPSPKILAFAGSTRTDSFNKKLVKIAAEGARSAGAEVTLVDLRDYPFPMYDGDVEKAGVPAKVTELRKIFNDHNGLLIASPEYNASVTAVLKNTIDWVSRPLNGEPNLGCLSGKTAAIISASPSGFGGMRGLNHLRAILTHVQVTVIPNQVSVSSAQDAFDEGGALKDQKKQADAQKIGAILTQTMKKLLAE